MWNELGTNVKKGEARIWGNWKLEKSFLDFQIRAFFVVDIFLCVLFRFFFSNENYSWTNELRSIVRKAQITFCFSFDFSIALLRCVAFATWYLGQFLVNREWKHFSVLCLRWLITMREWFPGATEMQYHVRIIKWNTFLKSMKYRKI